jgi:hypothetical protein
MSKLYGAFSKEQRYKLIEESLDLIVTYFGQDSDIFVHTSERSLEYGHPTQESFQHFYTRFILAKWIAFKEIVESMDSILTSDYKPAKQEFIGKIQGTLLVPEYVTTKWNNILEKRYPCLISYEDFNTPENAFVFQVLTKIYDQLRRLPLPKNSGEFAFQQKALLDCTNMLQHPVFQIVKASPFYNMKLEQLLSLVKTRNRRGQMGNVKKFELLIKWFESLSWSTIIHYGPEKLDLAFGSNPNTWDKFFEVWVLAKLLKALEGKGKELFGTVELNMASLEHRGVGPIATIEANKLRLEIYYQNSTLLTSRWKYNGGDRLHGIPDIIISVKRHPNFLIMIDVKNILFEGRKDGNAEKYKMLGYFESFRDSLKHQPVGILILRNDKNYFSDCLYTEENAQLSLFTVSPGYSIDAFLSIALYIWEFAQNPPEITAIEPNTNEDEKILISKREEAHNKATELALKKPEELLRCKNELRRYIFPTTWGYFPEECKTLLGMAELLYQNLQDQCGVDPDVDWGPAVLEYCRAVEYFFNHEIIIPFKNSAQFKAVIAKTSDPKMKAYQYLVSKNTLMFGELARLFRDLRNTSGGIFTFIKSKKHLNSNIEFWRKSLYKILSGININYRRKSAHIDLLSLKDVQNCRLRIIGSAENKGLLPNLFNMKT